MRIPRYTATASLTTQTPGVSSRARMNPQPFVQEALAKGEVFGEAAKQVGEFAQMRYKMEREAALDNALIGAEEQMREEYYRLSKLKTPHDVFGEKNLWETATQSIKERNRDLVGFDRSAQQAFDEAFDRSELSLRFSLRSKIDTNIEANNAAARKQRLLNAQRDGVAATDVKDVQLIFANIGIDSDRRANLKLGNPVVLKQQELSLLKNITALRLQNLLDGTTMPSTLMDAMRKAVIDDDQSALLNPVLEGQGLIEAELLKALPLQERITLLRGGEALAKYIDAPSLEEQKVLAAAKVEAKSVQEEIDVKKDLLKSGVKISTEELLNLSERAKNVLGTLDAEDQQALTNSLSTMSLFAEFQKGLSDVATPDNIDELYIVEKAREGNLSGKRGILDADDKLFLDYIDTFRENMVKGIETDPMQYFMDSGAMTVTPLTLTLEAANAKSVGLAARATTALRAQERFGSFYMPDVKLLTNEEANKIVGTIRNNPDAGFIMLQDMQAEAGKYGPDLMNQLEDAGLTPALVATADVRDASVRATLGAVSELKDAEVSELITATGKSEKTIDEIIAYELKDLRSAYVFGRGVEASTAFAGRVEAAKGVVAVFMSQGMHQDDAVEKALTQLFPAKNSVINTSDAMLYVPQKFSPKADQIERDLSYLKRKANKLFSLKPLSPIQMPGAPEATMVLNQDALRSRGKWLLNNTEDGAIFHYTLGDGTPIMALDANNRPYEVKFSKLPALRNNVQGVVMKEAEKDKDPSLGYFQEGQKLRSGE
mgnify:CR=1 FL=1